MRDFDPRAGEGRIRRLYERRDAAGLRRLYADDRGEMIAWRDARHAALSQALGSARLSLAEGRRILDIGCGTGTLLRELVTLGAVPGHLVGVDLLEDRLAEGRALPPRVPLVLGSGWALPLRGGTFDLVTLFTVLSSLPDRASRTALAEEVRRVARPEAHVLVYDFRIRRPGRDDLVGIGPAEVERMFASPVVWRRSLTLAPPIARLLGRFGPGGVRAVERFVPVLRTHRMYLVRLT